MIRFGLCCVFQTAPIRFKRTTARVLRTLSRKHQKEKLAQICGHNAGALREALLFCMMHGIGDFRINSQILPLKTHPTAGYDLASLPGGKSIVDAFKECGRVGREGGIRTTFHPDQFIVLSSPDSGVVARSTDELEYQAEVCDWVNADVINLHGGGAYGDKRIALDRLASVIRRLPDRIRSRLTLENDDRVYSPADLLPVCGKLGIPMVYDVHHHRCLPDGMTVAQATQAALATWNREPLFHVSSPLNGWDGPDIRKHADFLNPSDFPEAWRNLNITVEIEAKAKEAAVLQFMEWFGKGSGRNRSVGRSMEE